VSKIQGFVRLLIAVAFFFPNDAIAQRTTNEDYVTAAASVAGFCVSQEAHVDRFGEVYPDLKPRLDAALLLFNMRFHNVCDRANSTVLELFGPEKFQEFLTKMLDMVEPMLEQAIGSREVVEAFIDEVHQRSLGQGMNDEILVPLLAVRFSDEPHREITSGFTARFDGTGHSKSKGISFQLQVPYSWQAREGERPNIVQKWTRLSPNGYAGILIQVRDLEGYTPTEAEVRSIYTETDASEFLPASARYIAHDFFTIERQPAIWIDHVITEARLGMEFTVRGRMYMIFFDGRAIMFQGSSGNPADPDAILEEYFRRTVPVCNQVVNSLVLPEVYK
jgi:hypothetical protein